MQGGCHDADATPAMVHMDVDAVFFASGKRGATTDFAYIVEHSKAGTLRRVGVV